MLRLGRSEEQRENDGEANVTLCLDSLKSGDRNIYFLQHLFVYFVCVQMCPPPPPDTGVFARPMLLFLRTPLNLLEATLPAQTGN